jgi:hypothetical protein
MGSCHDGGEHGVRDDTSGLSTHAAIVEGNDRAA